MGYTNEFYNDFNQALNIDINSAKESESTALNYSVSLLSDNNVLTVSEEKQKAFLPYTVIDIKKILEDPKTKDFTYEQIINNIYTVDLNKFRFSSSSRFREAVKLVREKEKGSLSDAVTLGFELMFKYNLNPIIIAACRNIDELDIYLDCLDENELEDFDCFKINFEVSPDTIKHKLFKNNFESGKHF